jgi:hypothetical protein
MSWPNNFEPSEHSAEIPVPGWLVHAVRDVFVKTEYNPLAMEDILYLVKKLALYRPKVSLEALMPVVYRQARPWTYIQVRYMLSKLTTWYDITEEERLVIEEQAIAIIEDHTLNEKYDAFTWGIEDFKRVETNAYTKEATRSNNFIYVGKDGVLKSFGHERLNYPSIIDRKGRVIEDVRPRKNRCNPVAGER